MGSSDPRFPISDTLFADAMATRKTVFRDRFIEAEDPSWSGSAWEKKSSTSGRSHLGNLGLRCGLSLMAPLKIDV